MTGAVTDPLCSLARQIIQETEKRGVLLRALGGVGVALRCGEAIRTIPTLSRTHHDIDLAGFTNDKAAITSVLAAFGFGPDNRINLRTKTKRLVFFRDGDELKADVYLDCFEMCHAFSFGSRLEATNCTLNLTDLLLTKLQVLKPEAQDILDTCAILATVVFETPCDPSSLELSRISTICGQDWGWYRTARQTIGAVKHSIQSVLHNGHSESVYRMAAQVESVIVNAPRSLKWRCRAFFGDLVPWYRTPRVPAVGSESHMANKERRVG